MTPYLRWPFEYVDGVAGLGLDRVRVTIDGVRLDHCAAEWVRAPGVSGAGNPVFARRRVFDLRPPPPPPTAVWLVKEADAAVLTVAYRKLPATTPRRHRRRHQRLARLLDRGFDGDQIVVGGDSAGGYRERS